MNTEQAAELKELIFRYAEIREIEHGGDRRWLLDLHRGILFAFIDSLTERADTAESVARRFHETYERLAPEFGYETREASAVPWDAVPEANRRLMVATVREVLAGISERADTGLEPFFCAACGLPIGEYAQANSGGIYHPECPNIPAAPSERQDGTESNG